MNRDLLKEYADLTRELQDITRRRNEVGILLERERKVEKLAKAQAGEKALIDTLVRIAKSKPAGWEPEEWGEHAAKLGVTTWRLSELFSNLLLRVRNQFPEHDDILPRRVGPRTLERWSEWGKVLEKYKSAL